MRSGLKFHLLLLLLDPLQAHAQELQGFDVNAVPLPIAASPFAGVRGAEEKQLGDLHWGARTTYLLQPLSISYPSPSPEGVSAAVIEGAILFELGINLGLVAGFDAGLRMGATLDQWGPGIGAASGGTQPIASFGAIDPAVEIGWTANLKVLRVRPYASLRVPSGRQDAFAGDARARGEWGAAGTGKFWKIEWSAEVGMIYRPTTSVSGSNWGSQLRIAGGMLFQLGEAFQLGPELHLVPVLAAQVARDGTNAGYILPAEALLSARYNRKYWTLSAAIGTGLPLSRAGEAAPLSRGPTSPLLRSMVQFEMNLE